MTARDREDAFRAGDPAVFQELVTTESPRLLAYARHLVGERAAAEDLVQEVWLQAYRARHSYAGTGPLIAWLLAICRREAFAFQRREQRRLALSAELVQRARHDGELEREEDAAGPDLGSSLVAAIADLPEQQRNVLVCRILEDRSTRETALRLGIAEGTVKATLHQALNKLRHLTRGEDHG